MPQPPTADLDGTAGAWKNTKFLPDSGNNLKLVVSFEFRVFNS